MCQQEDKKLRIQKKLNFKALLGFSLKPSTGFSQRFHGDWRDQGLKQEDVVAQNQLYSHSSVVTPMLQVLSLQRGESLLSAGLTQGLSLQALPSACLTQGLSLQALCALRVHSVHTLAKLMHKNAHTV